jgi:hypothetical protein
LSKEEEDEVNNTREDVKKAHEEEIKEANKSWWQKAGEFAFDMVPIVGHNNYMPGKSILTESAQGLLVAFHSGNVNSLLIINEVKTRVNFGKTIGNYIKDGLSNPTTNGIIINAKNGVHIVPSAPF